MKREIKRVLSVWLAVFLLLSSMPMTGVADFFALRASAAGIVSGTCGDNLTWTLEDDVLTISGEGAMNDYLWPEEVDESTPQSLRSPFRFLDYFTLIVEEGVTRLGDCAFEESGTDSHFLQFVSLPSTLREIGTFAFDECASLKSITLPQNLEKIEGYAFADCSLDTVTIPKSVREIGGNAFLGVKKMFLVEEDNPVFASLEGSLCFAETDELIQAPIVPKDGENYTVPFGVKKLRFRSICNTQAVRIILPSTVQEIEEEALTWNDKLQEIEVDKNNTTFYSKDGVLYDYAMQTLIQYPQAKTESIFHVPKGVKTIGLESFHNARFLVCVDLPESVQTIENSAFANCDMLERVVMGRVTQIGDYVFTCNTLQYVFYTGTPKDRAAIQMGEGNEFWTDAQWIYSTDRTSFVESVNFDFDLILNYKDTFFFEPEINADGYWVEYVSFDSSVFTVEEQYGKAVVTARGRGTATLTCTIGDIYGNTVTDSCEVTVQYAWWQWLIKILLFGWIWY